LLSGAKENGDTFSALEMRKGVNKKEKGNIINEYGLYKNKKYIL
jgi:hypothetical protein